MGTYVGNSSIEILTDKTVNDYRTGASLPGRPTRALTDASIMQRAYGAKTGCVLATKREVDGMTVWLLAGDEADYASNPDCTIVWID